MAFSITTARAAPIAAAVLALAGCGDAPQDQPTADYTLAQQVSDLTRACTRYDELEAAIQSIRAQQAGLAQPPAAGGGILVDRAPHCPHGPHVPHRPMGDILKDWLGPEPRTGPVPEGRLAELERAAARAAAEAEWLAARVHPRL